MFLFKEKLFWFVFNIFHCCPKNYGGIIFTYIKQSTALQKIRDYTKYLTLTEEQRGMEQRDYVTRHLLWDPIALFSFIALDSPQNSIHPHLLPIDRD